MKSLKLFTVVIMIIGMSGCLSFRSGSTPGPQGPQGAQGTQGTQGTQGPAGTSEKIIVVPEKSY